LERKANGLTVKRLVYVIAPPSGSLKSFATLHPDARGMDVTFIWPAQFNDPEKCFAGLIVAPAAKEGLLADLIATKSSQGLFGEDLPKFTIKFPFEVVRHGPDALQSVKKKNPVAGNLVLYMVTAAGAELASSALELDFT